MLQNLSNQNSKIFLLLFKMWNKIFEKGCPPAEIYVV